MIICIIWNIYVYNFSFFYYTYACTYIFIHLVHEIYKIYKNCIVFYINVNINSLIIIFWLKIL